MSQEKLLSIIDQECSMAPSIAVIGDLMLDRYLYGSVERISPEAPIPVVKFQGERGVLGGAGNVVANLCGLGAAVQFFAQLGDDSEAQDVLKLLEGLNAKSRGKVALSPSLKDLTTVKTRIIGNGRQQMLRLDRETFVPLEGEAEVQLLRAMASLADDGLAAVILSDYGKGMCTASLCRNVIGLCRTRGIPVFVDPKGRDWQRYAGAELVTPNVKELSDVAGTALSNDDDEALLTQARKVRSEFGLDNLLVTRSEKGSTFVGEENCFDEPSHAVDVYDVSGAGDTVIASVAFFRACGIPWRESCQLSNLAAQVVISKPGTYPVSYDELRSLVRENVTRERKTSPASKVMSFDEALALVEKCRKTGKKVVFTNGCFDVFHAGHVDSLQRAKALGDCLIVGLNSDRSVRALKGVSRPINTEENRAAVLAALQCVDGVVIFDEDTPERLLSALRPDVLVKGGDYAPEQIAGASYAGKVIILPLVPELSSTALLDRMSKNG
ncbi:MAG: D-glycero-beta-D-manno-heptose 1-phosphate adenylyltransferase [Pyramidobacter sp.]|jgi:D-beta-D-heptose 7-phosphate kinase/D-beta-D-heptose 1-phosphate adenosyltransferase